MTTEIVIGEEFTVPFKYNEVRRSSEHVCIYEKYIPVKNIGMLEVKAIRYFFDLSRRGGFKVFNGKPLNISIVIPSSDVTGEWAWYPLMPVELWLSINITNPLFKSEEFVRNLAFQLSHDQYGTYRTTGCDNFDIVENIGHYEATVFDGCIDYKSGSIVLYFDPKDPTELQQCKFKIL